MTVTPVGSVIIMAVSPLRSCSLIAALMLAGCSPKPQSPAPAQLPPVGATAQPQADLRPVIAAFGDSLTAGYGVEPGQTYPDDLQRLLDAGGYRYRVANLGVSGNTTTDGLERLAEVLAAKPVIVIVEFGGNDGLRGLPVSTTFANQAQIVEALQNSGAKILLAGMSLPRNYGPEYIRSFEQVYLDLASKYHLARIPFLLEGVGGHPELLQQDGIHPTARGCQIVAANVVKYLKPLLQK